MAGHSRGLTPALQRSHHRTFGMTRAERSASSTPALIDVFPQYFAQVCTGFTGWQLLRTSPLQPAPMQSPTRATVIRHRRGIPDRDTLQALRLAIRHSAFDFEQAIAASKILEVGGPCERG